MKCIKSKNDGKIKRVKESVAEALVNSGSYVYVPKHVWKAAGIKEGGRSTKPKKNKEVEEVTHVDTSQMTAAAKRRMHRKNKKAKAAEQS